jgi:hypothetical protein
MGLTLGAYVGGAFLEMGQPYLAPLIAAVDQALKIRPYWSGRNPTTPMKNSGDPVT